MTNLPGVSNTNGGLKAAPDVSAGAAAAGSAAVTNGGSPVDAKRLVKLAISIVYFLLVSSYNLIRRALGRRPAGTAVLLYYHGIRAEHRSRFARQMDVLLRWATPIRANHRGPLPDGRRFAGVTFDDALLSFGEIAVPELQKRGIPATVFVVAHQLGQYPDWPGFIFDRTFSEPMLTAEQLKALPGDLITIGSHTSNHPYMTRVSESEARRELSESRRRLEAEFGRPVTLFSFPHGDHHEDLVQWSREAGYDRVFTILPKPAFATPDEYAVGRVLVDPGDWPIEYLLKLLGGYYWLPVAFALKRRITSIGSGRKVGLRPSAV